MVRRTRRGDDGFTLVESLVALTIAAAVLAALGAATLTAARASVAARAAQQAGNLLNEYVEAARSADYTAVTMVASDLAGDPEISGSPGSYTYAGTGEPVVADTVGLISPHVTTLTRNDVSYTIRRYVTNASDASGTYKRVTVVVDWSMFEKDKSRRVSTLLVETRRGLPLPRFSFALSGGTSSPQTVGAGLPVTWGLWVQNLGARDGWNITSDDGQAWTYYVDVNKNGIWDAATETGTLGDVDGNGVVDTGNLETNTASYFVAVRTPATGEPTTQTPTFSAGSIAQPPPASAVKVQPTSFTITGATSPTGASCPAAVACNLVGLHLDQLADGNLVTANKPMRLLADPGNPQVALNNYSTELGNGSGRNLTAGGLLTPGTNNQNLVADFRYQVPSGQTHTFQGTASLTLHLACTGSVPASLAAHVGTSTNNSNLGNFTDRVTPVTFTAPCTGSASTVSVLVPVPTAFSTGQYVTLRLVSDAPANLRLLYDAVGYDSTLTMPRTAP